jgi:hypothetical protein
MRTILFLICSLSCFAQGFAVSPYRFAAAGGGGGGGTAAVTSYTPGTARNNSTAAFGINFIADSNMTVTELGRWVISGNSQTHTVTIRNNAGASLGSVSIDASSGAGAFKYAVLSSPVSLTAGNRYWILSDETNGGDQWYNGDSAVSFTADFSSIFSAYFVSVGDFGSEVSGKNHGPVSFKYTIP